MSRAHPIPEPFRPPRIDRALVINLDSRPDRWLEMQLHLARRSIAVQRFPAVENSIPETYRQLATFALDNHLDLGTMIVQDDQGFNEPPRLGSLAVTVYGTGTARHICPRAFAASPTGWEELADVWIGEVEGEENRGLVCRQWRPLVHLVENLSYQRDPGSRGTL